MFHNIQDLLDIMSSFLTTKYGIFQILDFTFAKNERHAKEREFSAAPEVAGFIPRMALRSDPGELCAAGKQRITLARAK
jgi:hypothetical protein